MGEGGSLVSCQCLLVQINFKLGTASPILGDVQNDHRRLLKLAIILPPEIALFACCAQLDRTPCRVETEDGPDPDVAVPQTQPCPGGYDEQSRLCVLGPKEIEFEGRTLLAYYCRPVRRRLHYSGLACKRQ